ncbi:MAG: hypothetical protein H6704_18855 [Myxococcales bacterium]|nr:hypothetical protein [Myxococcales bacterium]
MREGPSLATLGRVAPTLCLVGLLGGAAGAAPPDAEALFVDRDYLTAAAVFEARYAADGEPTTLRFAALSWTGAGEVERAEGAWRRLLALRPRGPLAAEARAALARLRADHYGEIIVRCTPGEARVEVIPTAGGRPVRGACPGVSATVRAGWHQVTVRAPGWSAQIEQVLVRPGSSRELVVTLARPAPASALGIDAREGASLVR